MPQALRVINVWCWRMLFFLTVDMIIPLLTAAVGLTCLAKTVSFAFRIIVITELPVTHSTCSRVDVRDESGGNWPGYFSTIWSRCRRGHSSVQCSSHWTSRVKFYLTVPAGWEKTLTELCYSPLGEQVRWFAFLSPCTSFLYPLLLLFLPPLFSLIFAKYFPKWRNCTSRLDSSLGDQ
jgi:hypothetical protein